MVKRREKESMGRIYEFIGMLIYTSRTQCAGFNDAIGTQIRQSIEELLTKLYINLVMTTVNS